MNALIIGAAGFVGGYLIDHLRERGWSVCASKLPQEQIDREGVAIFNLDILDAPAIKNALEKYKPDSVFHLAAQSSVAVSWKNPTLTIDVNIKGSVNVLEAARTMEQAPRILLVGSGEEYGHVRPDEIPIREENALRPGNIYAATKACQGMIGKIYADAYAMDVMMVRAFNHIGPGQASTFVVSDFCRQVAEIEAGLREPIMRVGNLSAKRDFTDVRDVVRGYALLMEKGKRGEFYNIGGGEAVSIEGILKMVLQASTKEIQVEVDPAKLRPVDIPEITPDVDSMHELTGWTPQVKLKETIADTLAYWRDYV
jgi:GDP-4-dehydro-6-deoxy-D-mannose reductase